MKTLRTISEESRVPLGTLQNRARTRKLGTVHGGTKLLNSEEEKELLRPGVLGWHAHKNNKKD